MITSYNNAKKIRYIPNFFSVIILEYIVNIRNKNCKIRQNIYMLF